MKEIVTASIKEFLEKQGFINIATCGFDNIPNVAPKFLLRINNDYIFLADYVMGKTYRNIKINPRVSLSTLNTDTLIGYQMNGATKIVEKGSEFELLMEDFHKKQIQLCVTRIIEGVQKESKHGIFETDLPEHIAIFKIKIEEVVEIVSTGELTRRKKKDL